MTAAAVMAKARPSVLGKRCPARALAKMYPAQTAPAPAAKPIPAGVSRSNPALLSNATPAAARAAHNQLAARRAVTTDSMSGPSTSSITTGPSGISAIAW
jgi:hypothetical protein